MEAVRFEKLGQSIAKAARSLGVVEQTPANLVRTHRATKLKEADGKRGHAEKMAIARLRAELARVTMGRDILGEPTAYFTKDEK